MANYYITSYNSQAKPRIYSIPLSGADSVGCHPQFDLSSFTLQAELYHALGQASAYILKSSLLSSMRSESSGVYIGMVRNTKRNKIR